MTNKSHLLFMANGWEYEYGWSPYDEATGHVYYLSGIYTPDGVSRSVFLFN